MEGCLGRGLPGDSTLGDAQIVAAGEGTTTPINT
jgi:hypothetical protein